MNNLMIDLETMGKNKDAPIVSIGAVFFTPETGDIGQESSSHWRTCWASKKRVDAFFNASTLFL
mgnify:CR=1 FL=1